MIPNAAYCMLPLGQRYLAVAPDVVVQMFVSVYTYIVIHTYLFKYVLIVHAK